MWVRSFKKSKHWVWSLNKIIIANSLCVFCCLSITFFNELFDCDAIVLMTSMVFVVNSFNICWWSIKACCIKSCWLICRDFKEYGSLSMVMDEKSGRPKNPLRRFFGLLYIWLKQSTISRIPYSLKFSYSITILCT